MTLYRVIHWDGHSLGRTGVGPLFVPRRHQGAGRHDAPDLYGAWYCTTNPLSAIAERLHSFRGQVVVDEDFQRLGNLSIALVTLELDASVTLLDLDEPGELAKRRLRPSLVVTPRRNVTQQMARRLFEEGGVGFSWWSTLVADWTNVTLFHERALAHVRVTGPPQPLSTRMPEVQQAADELGVRIGE